MKRDYYRRVNLTITLDPATYKALDAAARHARVRTKQNLGIYVDVSLGHIIDQLVESHLKDDVKAARSHEDKWQSSTKRRHRGETERKRPSSKRSTKQKDRGERVDA